MIVRLGAFAAIPGALLILTAACGRRPSEPSIRLDAFKARQSYTTRFSMAEPALSENGRWHGGKSAGRDWADVGVADGLAYGGQNGRGGYDDATAVLTGFWTPDQMAEATVRCANPNDTVYQEVELRLRSALSPHVATGYEINFRCSKTAEAYAEIVRWDGPLGKFTYLTRGRGSDYGVATGDTVSATAVGDVITAYINGVPMLQATDRAFPGGSPGVGFFLQGATSPHQDYGFTSFVAANAP